MSIDFFLCTYEIINFLKAFTNEKKRSRYSLTGIENTISSTAHRFGKINIGMGVFLIKLFVVLE